ncbi:hypothetical protein VNO77_39570 [Canavalia gladiata]|uniref:Uncharacterized protein n=1 Tax=Canavalia gladiata TaxID=3824 RepID=A0AAN9PR47_CANGL
MAVISVQLFLGFHYVVVVSKDIRNERWSHWQQFEQVCVCEIWDQEGGKRLKLYVAYSLAMFFGGSRRVLYFSVVVLMVVTVLQMWVCCHSCQVGAIRVFPSNVKFSHGIMDKKVKEDLLLKHFGGRTFGPSNGTHKGFHDNKRRVPSCPDPLHN